MVNITLIPRSEFQRIHAAPIDLYAKLALIADMCRANTLAMVKRAGSGHLGSSFSAMDIVTWLYYQQMNTAQLGISHPDRDIYFSSKGHDVPGLYSVLYSLGIVPEEKLLKLRRFGGLDGHPDVGISGIEANSGSLGMGISKGRGMAWAKRLLGRSGDVFVMTGDGELQEGQNYEALQTAVHQQVGNLTIIIDNNKVQSDKQVCEIVDLGDLKQKLQAFGWHVARCDGHDFEALQAVFEEFKTVTHKPKALIADTLKGRGVSFMEHPAALKISGGLYPWHAGAPDDASFTAAYDELIERVNSRLADLKLESLTLQAIPPEEKSTVQTLGALNLLGEPVSEAARDKLAAGVSDEYVAEAFGQALVELAAQRSDLVVLDGDLAADCRIRKFELAYPDRFIENGIAEQDMVSMAGGLARQGLLPVVNSFASFLAARANEQIYNNASEKSKIIYACHYAGLIPAGPGKSHQSIRDISLFGALPNCVIIQPGTAAETKLAVEYCVNQAEENCVLRLVIGPSPRKITLPENYNFTLGQGVALSEGQGALLFAYGPVMLHEALLASELLAERNFGLKVVNMPWLNRVDAAWLAQVVSPYPTVYVLEDHAPVGGLGDFLLNVLMAADLLNGRKLHKFAVEGYPACGTPAQALKFHHLDGLSLGEQILQRSRGNA
ncbi:MAG: 1-deoxy-D-xylulose-5-phosphate synthase [Anaerolineae bacterium]|nr:1-deoxy-D-xylulose-5-phosphate synthase [Anaerolineae bacterium]